MGTKKTFKCRIKDSLKWFHLAALLSILLVCSDHVLEALIVLVLLYDIGFEIPGMDRLAEYNNDIRRWVLKKFRHKKS